MSALTETSVATANLTSCLSLAKRAQEQFDALKAKVDAFLQDDPWGTEVARDKDGWVLRTTIPKQPPEDWWMDVGDLAGNARQALDHLVFQLAIDSGSSPEKDRTQFPIFEVEDDYRKGGSRSWRERMLAGVASRHRKLIDGYQPYKLGTAAPDHPLAMLRSLTDRHKHREQHVGAALLDQFTVEMLYADGSGVGVTIGKIKNPDPVLDKHVIHATYPADQLKYDFETETSYHVPVTGLEIIKPAKFTIGFFGDRPFRIEDIGSIPPYVSGIIGRFERRIASKGPSAGSSS